MFSFRFSALVVAGGLMICAAPSSAQSINVDQLLRVLRGETITECPDEREFTSEFSLEGRSFVAGGANPYVSLRPSYQLHLTGVVESELVERYLTVLGETLDISFEMNGKLHRVSTRVIEERDLVDGELVEVTRHYYARDQLSNNVFSFGADVSIYEDGKPVTTEGSWRAGVRAAKPGLVMPGTFLLGARYVQAHAPGAALERAEHVAMGVTIDVPAGRFGNCIVVRESSGEQSPEAENEGEKTFAPGVGLVQDESLKLISAGFIEGDDGED